MRASCRGWSSLSPGMRLPPGSTVGSRQVMELPSVNKAFQDILLNVKVVVANGREPVTELGEVFDGLFDPIGGDVISSRLGAEAQVIAGVLFEAAGCVVSTNEGIGQIEVFDNGLKLSLVILGDLATEDGGDLAGLVRARPDWHPGVSGLIDPVRRAGERSGCRNPPLGRKKAGADSRKFCVRFL